MPDDRSSASVDDASLVRAMAAGDARALEALYARHGASLLRYLVGQLDGAQQAEEVLQDVMLAAWRAAERFRGESQVRTWLIAIARHHIISQRRRRRAPLADLDDELGADGTGPLERVARDERALALHEALRQLPPAQRETLELVFFYQLSGPEAAQVLGVSVGTVKSRLHRAKETLRGLLGERGFGYA